MKTLESQLVLLPFMCQEFGFESVEAMIECLCPDGEETTGDIDNYWASLVKYINKDKIDIEKIHDYHTNIKNITSAMSQNRPDLKWKAYQYCALIFVEHYLHMFFKETESLRDRLNSTCSLSEQYTIDDLKKVCIQSATGSGKTLLLHANIRQYRHYYEKHKRKSLNKVILVTPDENMSGQHIKEMQKSGLQGRLFSTSNRDLFSEGGLIVEVIDIHKLDNADGIKKVAVSGFGKNNLVVVDEGHLGDKVWRGLRKSLLDNGFCYEYSATFSQAVKAKKELMPEYSKSLIFNYSYSRFYNEGYGKDYSIHNLKKANDEDEVRTVLMACIMSFFQQVLIYGDNAALMEKYNIAKPLCVFLGKTVQRNYKKTDDTRSDVHMILSFMTFFLAHENFNQVLHKIQSIIADAPLIIDDDEGDKVIDLEHIRTMKPVDIHKGITEIVFHGSGKLNITLLSNCDELLLSTGKNKPFCIIKIGDAKGFYSEISEVLVGDCVLKTDKISKPQFALVDRNDSSVMIAIGARKFVAGWNSWRVSTMALLHVGQSEGPQIIQMFGRGVRLMGYDMTMKRHTEIYSEDVSEANSKLLSHMETLNIFGIKANYMSEFSNYISNTQKKERNQYAVNTKLNQENFKDLMILKSKSWPDYNKEQIPFSLEPPDQTYETITIKGYLSLQTLRSQDISTTNKTMIGMKQFSCAHIKLFDRNVIYQELLKEKQKCKWDIMFIPRAVVYDLIDDDTWYAIEATESYFQFEEFRQISTWQRVMTKLLMDYASLFWKRKRGEWEFKNMEIQRLSFNHPNFIKKYKVEKESQVGVKDETLENMLYDLGNIKERPGLAKMDFSIQTENIAGLASIFTKMHAYEPLIQYQQESRILRITPDFLNEGEASFVNTLIEAAKAQGQSLSKNILLMRNLCRGHGIHIFSGISEYYPDFILWLLEKDNERVKQHIVFIDPKGLGHAEEKSTQKKIDLHKNIKIIQKNIQRKNKDVYLHSYIWCVSDTIRLKIDKSSFKQRGVYFKEDGVSGILDMLAHIKTNLVISPPE